MDAFDKLHVLFNWHCHLCSVPLCGSGLKFSYIGTRSGFDIVMPSYQYKNSHHENKMISWQSYVYNWNSCVWENCLYFEMSSCMSWEMIGSIGWPVWTELELGSQGFIPFWACHKTYPRLLTLSRPDGYRLVCLVSLDISRVSCQKGPTRHAYAWQIGPFWQDTLDILEISTLDSG